MTLWFAFNVYTRLYNSSAIQDGCCLFEVKSNSVTEWIQGSKLGEYIWKCSRDIEGDEIRLYIIHAVYTLYHFV